MVLYMHNIVSEVCYNWNAEHDKFKLKNDNLLHRTTSIRKQAQSAFCR
uniref:Uncharacterized protein n=1 Tax=Arundo donax TaxID=35708 RepID=A0A0A8YC82_ARUDO